MKACIFDLDGTLADTLESMAFSANKVIEKYGYKPLPAENFKFYAGDGAKMLVERVLKESGDSDLNHLDEAFKLYTEVFDANCTYKIKPYNGICDLLENLKKQNIKMAVLSNKPHKQTIKVIEALFGEKYFDVIQGQTEEVPKKPSPIGAFKIAERFDVLPEDCLYIGDTNTDMQTGKNAGMITMGVLWGFRNREELLENGAMNLAQSPNDILQYCINYEK